MRVGFRYYRRAFTLIELLVVVAIIALLIGILLPALGNARRTAQGLVSQANLRSLGQIQAVYAGEHRDSLINPFNTSRVSGGFMSGGWGSVRKPGRAGVYIFGDTGKWYTEMYAFHWYSLVGGWLSESDYASEVQFAPLDVDLITRVEAMWYESPTFTLNNGIWDGSYVLSPTMWFAAERYKNDSRPNAYANSGPRSMAKRNRMSDVAFSSLKVMMWERFDWTSKTRKPSVFNPAFPDFGANDLGSEMRSPQWNNTEAEPAVVTVDGSVSKVSMEKLKQLATSENVATKRAFSPTDLWNPSLATLRRYGMHEDGFEIGHAESGRGLYPAYFWATRDGIRGRDFQR